MDAVLQTRFFSLQEANALIGLLQQRFTRARALRDQLTALQERLAQAGHPVDITEVTVEPDASPAAQRLQRTAVRALEELHAVLRDVAEIGVEIKAADGLVDFRSKLHGRPVFLCWRFGEERIHHYHELDSGFGGRRPLPPDADFVGDLVH